MGPLHIICPEGSIYLTLFTWRLVLETFVGSLLYFLIATLASGWPQSYVGFGW